MSAPRKPWLAFTVALLAAFAYGIATERCSLFPHALLESAFGASAGEPAPLAPERDTPSEPEPEPEPETSALVPSAQQRLAPRFHRARERLAVVPYAAGVQPAGSETLVTLHDPEAAYPGLNLMVSGHAPEALLIDMHGNVVHRWACAFATLWPGQLQPDEGIVSTTYWRRVHLFPNGDLLAIFEGIGMVKLDKDSRVLWKYRGKPHHDIDVDADGNIYTLTRQNVVRQQPGWLRGPVAEDYVTVLSPQGSELRRVSVLDAIVASKYVSVLFRRAKDPDIMHTNTVELLDGRHAARFPVLRRGHVLISIRNLDMVAVVDLEHRVVTWAMTEMWRRQHQPTMLDNGNMLVFDNRGNAGSSRVLELDPATHEIIWSYDGSPELPLRSWTLGSCQRLPNGNTLITESEPGRVIEVTPDKTIVWEYVNPHRAGERGELIASVFEMIRFDPSQLAFPLQRGSAPSGR